MDNKVTIKVFETTRKRIKVEAAKLGITMADYVDTIIWMVEDSDLSYEEYIAKNAPESTQDE